MVTSVKGQGHVAQFLECHMVFTTFLKDMMFNELQGGSVLILTAEIDSFSGAKP